MSTWAKKGGGGNHNFNIGNSSIMLYYYTICMPVNGAIQDVLWKKDIKDIVFNKKNVQKVWVTLL